MYKEVLCNRSKHNEMTLIKLIPFLTITFFTKLNLHNGNVVTSSQLFVIGNYKLWIDGGLKKYGESPLVCGWEGRQNLTKDFWVEMFWGCSYKTSQDFCNFWFFKLFKNLPQEWCESISYHILTTFLWNWSS